MYSLDTSVFMDWQARHYPLDLFPGLARRIEALIDGGECRAVDLVREELSVVGTPDVRVWIAKHKALFLSLSPEVQTEAAAIQATYPELMDPKGMHDSADAFVIAFARSAGRNRRISGDVRRRKAQSKAALLHPRCMSQPRRAVHQLAGVDAA